MPNIKLLTMPDVPEQKRAQRRAAGIAPRPSRQKLGVKKKASVSSALTNSGEQASAAAASHRRPFDRRWRFGAGAESHVDKCHDAEKFQARSHLATPSCAGESCDSLSRSCGYTQRNQAGPSAQRRSQDGGQPVRHQVMRSPMVGDNQEALQSFGVRVWGRLS